MTYPPPLPDRPGLVPLDTRDPRRVTALSHPLRFAIMRELGSRNEARVVDIARALGEAPNLISFHLRTLVRHGFVERVDHEGDQREKWWRTAAPRGVQVPVKDMMDAGGQARLAAETANATFRAYHLDRLMAWFAAANENTDHEDPARGNTDVRLRLTEHEVAQLLAELRDLVARWGETSRAQTDPTARSVDVVIWTSSSAPKTR